MSQNLFDHYFVQNALRTIIGLPRYIRNSVTHWSTGKRSIKNVIISIAYNMLHKHIIPKLSHLHTIDCDHYSRLEKNPSSQTAGSQLIIYHTLLNSDSK